MKFYLSSFKFGNEIEKLRSMKPANNRIGHINNSRDFTKADPERKSKAQAEEIEQLSKLGFMVESLDLREYFFKENELRDKLNTLGAVWISGGNTFVLRQAMKLSGFDNLVKELSKKDDFLYAGYSAGICVLSDSLKALQIVDDPYDYPYPEMKETIWEGLGFFSYAFLPHYDSDHFESEAIGKEVQNCIDKKWPFIALRDGDVIIIEKQQFEMREK